jgi:hypothetical protein
MPSANEGLYFAIDIPRAGKLNSPIHAEFAYKKGESPRALKSRYGKPVAALVCKINL